MASLPCNKITGEYHAVGSWNIQVALLCVVKCDVHVYVYDILRLYQYIISLLSYLTTLFSQDIWRAHLRCWFPQWCRLWANPSMSQNTSRVSRSCRSNASASKGNWKTKKLINSIYIYIATSNIYGPITQSSKIESMHRKPIQSRHLGNLTISRSWVPSSFWTST